MSEKHADKDQSNILLTSKETEDLFKIAFRNYNQLISVADSKASLLINVNSLIISFMLAFVVSKAKTNMELVWPATILLAASALTVFLSILASQPQKNSILEDKSSRSYQKFYFGSFDLIDSSFRHVTWEDYYKNLCELFTSTKERVFMEVYKESFNVRRVLSKKFDYLSKAYWVFIIGLILSIVSFMVVM